MEIMLIKPVKYSFPIYCYNSRKYQVGQFDVRFFISDRKHLIKI